MGDRVILSLVIFLSFYLTLGYYPLFNLDEGAFSEATREMVVGGDYITTYLNGALRFDKPILIYWLQALSGKLLGFNEIAMRLPSALAATAWAYLIYHFTERHFGREKAFLATLFMAGSIQISIIAKAAIADALLNLFIALSLFSFYTYLEEGRKGALYLAFAAVALGTLTKGPVAIVIPGVVALLSLWGKWALLLRTLFDPVGILIFLAIAAPWYIAEYLEQGERFIEGFILKHNLSRFGGESMEGHGGSPLYYLVVLLIGLIPFTSVALKALGGIKGWFETPLKRYLAFWFLFVFIFFTLSKTKLPHYIIYGYTPLFILMSLYFEKIRSSLLLFLPYLLFHGLFFLLPFLKPLVLEYGVKPGSYEFHIVEALHFGWSYILYFGATLLIGLWLLKWEKRKGIVVASLVTLISLNLFIAKVYAEAAEEPIREAALLARERGWSVKMEGINVPSFNFYLGKINDPKSDIILTKREALDRYREKEILYQKGGIALIRRRNDTGVHD
ncbi:MAG: glycosyltransferase family 39 protein [Epsilonproteobacteria bacterium]|nr:phospholipid carrier-dependent glycosyltransferase [Campylobacterota bacterium]NPA57581.1 glycosyltransferase family 39 protein [Campylobacterota bacterium]